MRTDLADALTPDLREASRVEANAWIKRLRLVPFDGRTMRERFTYRDDSLWWFTELYLHKMRQLDTAVAVTLALDAMSEAHQPARIVFESDDRTSAETAAAFGHARGTAIEVHGPANDPDRRERDGFLVGLTARLSRLRSARSRPGRGTRVAAFVHTAFWRESGESDGPERESYIGPVLGALDKRLDAGALRCIGVGPRRNFRARRWWDPVTSPSASRPLVIPVERLSRRSDLQESLALWTNRHQLARAITSGDAIRQAGRFRGVDLWSVLQRELEGAAIVQWPWSARAMDEAGAALDVLAPESVLTYAEAGGWGRALVLEARRRGARSIGLQHGFIYRHWLNYRHEPDEMTPIGDDRGFPAPDRTLLYDDYAARYLEAAGHFPSDRLVVTGNPGLDRLAAKIASATEADRRAVRATLGLSGGEPLAVLATKFSEARVHLPDLAAAIGSMPGVRLVIKTHPAETPDLYAPFFAQVPNSAIAPAGADLAGLLAIASAVVTVNSTVAIDAMSLGVPALVIGLPNNLSPFVSAGVMLGATSGGEIAGRLRTLLYDEEARRRLAESASAFTRDHGMTSDGRAADRAADEILRPVHRVSL